jgi:hypothetical protein
MSANSAVHTLAGKAFAKFTPPPQHKFGPFGVVLQSFLYSEPEFPPKLRMDTDRVEPEPRVLIKEIQGCFPVINDSRVVLYPLFVDKLWGLVDHFTRKYPASLRSNSMKGNGAAFGPNLNDDFTLVHYGQTLVFSWTRQFLASAGVSLAQESLAGPAGLTGSHFGS